MLKQEHGSTWMYNERNLFGQSVNVINKYYIYILFYPKVME